MTVDHKAIREALETAAVKPDGIIIKESKYFPSHWYVERGNEELRDNCLYWLRQLLDENQALRQIKLEVGGLDAGDIQELIAMNRSLISENQAQAKEIEQLRADKAAAVEGLRKIRDKVALAGNNEYYHLANTTLQRIESGDTDETR